MRNVLFAALGLLAACASTSTTVPSDQALPSGEIVAAAPDGTYRLTGANESCGNCEPPEIRAKERANAFCAQSGKVLDTARSRFNTGIGHRYTLVFACVDRR